MEIPRFNDCMLMVASILPYKQNAEQLNLEWGACVCMCVCVCKRVCIHLSYVPKDLEVRKVVWLGGRSMGLYGSCLWSLRVAEAHINTIMNVRAL